MDLQIASALLELLFVFVILAALCHQRERIGVAPLTMAFGAMMFFGTLMSAAEVYAPLPRGGEFNVAQLAVFLPLLTSFLMVYITMGALKAQRLLLGIMGSFLLYIYFVMLLRMQCAHLPEGPLREVALLLLSNGSASVNLSAVSNLIAYFTVPIFYSILPRRAGRTSRIIIALTAAQLMGAIPEAALLLINRNPAAFPVAGMLTVLAATPVIGAVLSLYLTMLEKELPESAGGRFDFLFAFFGSYSRVKELEDDLSSWENRYHLILRHAVEGVVMCLENGVIQDANIAAGKIFGVNNSSSLIGHNLFKMLKSDENTDFSSAVSGPIYFNGRIGRAGTEKIISASLSPIQLKKRLLLVLVCRDITGEVTLAKEKEELAEQLRHSQRMESLGMLAGGIAHDFNNCIHAIMGHADVAEMLYTGDPEKVRNHLQKISGIAEKAGKLTSQLLGFARKGKYNVVDIDVPVLLDECAGLLDPFRTRNVNIRNSFASGRWIMRGDQIQMQQVVLNLLINALDATAGNENERIIELSCGAAVNAPLKFTAPAETPDVQAGDYLYFAIRDNGAGMDETVKRKIFEPFFTTKPVGSGTGMGLAMVYGTVTHHRGWIQLHSTPGEGTLFCFFFPEADKTV
ncbi:MAG: PAS domain S-box protein [Lentisphaeria bacterium]|nr:PAS domain S-box protein [Lentisphaeria bacterium]